MSKLLLDIQGLRCLAVLFVLLFHIWPKLFANGFLGVDIFFVISGYLMCQVLHGKPVNLPTSADFYVRRIRRILPLYLCIIIATLVAAFHVMPVFEHSQVAMEARSAMFFVSNYMNLPKSGYFDVSNQYPLFLHTWSLSVEIQFYAVVPLIFWIYRELTKSNGNYGHGFLAAVSTACLLAQLALETNYTNLSHMAFFCRVWQFVCGIGACLYRLRSEPGRFVEKTAIFSLSSETRLLEHSKNNVATQRSRNPKPTQTLFTTYILPNIFVFLLCFQLSTNPIRGHEYKRILATFTSTLFLCLDGTSILSSELLVRLGDVSYAMYLIHWPLLIVYKYSEGRDAILSKDGFLLISITVVTAYFVENMFKTLSTCLSNWRTLLLLLIILYRIAFTTTVTMEILASSEVRTQYSRGVDVEKVAVDLYEHPERMKNLTAEEVVDVNNQIRDFQWTRFASCRNKTKSLDTDYKFGMENIEEFCHARGTGTKEIVLVGNSLAKDFEYSVTSSMKDVYSRFTMFGTHLCMPFLPELFVKQKPKCQGFSDDVVPILRQWQRPIDIVITVHSWNELRIHKFSRNDHYQQVIQNFYSELNKIARELVILNRGDINTPKPFQVIQNAVRRGLNLDRFNYPFSQNEQQNSEVYKRVDNLNCPKCLKANLYQESFCSNATNSCCLVNENGVANFHDGRHMTTFGSLVMGRTLRRLYDGLGKL